MEKLKLSKFTEALNDGVKNIIITEDDTNKEIITFSGISETSIYFDFVFEQKRIEINNVKNSVFYELMVSDSGTHGVIYGGKNINNTFYRGNFERNKETGFLVRSQKPENISEGIIFIECFAGKNERDGFSIHSPSNKSESHFKQAIFYNCAAFRNGEEDFGFSAENASYIYMRNCNGNKSKPFGHGLSNVSVIDCDFDKMVLRYNSGFAYLSNISGGSGEICEIEILPQSGINSGKFTKNIYIWYDLDLRRFSLKNKTQTNVFEKIATPEDVKAFNDRCLVEISSEIKDIEYFYSNVIRVYDPKTDDPKTDDPKTDDPKTDDPKTDDPETDDPKKQEIRLLIQKIENSIDDLKKLL